MTAGASDLPDETVSEHSLQEILIPEVVPTKAVKNSRPSVVKHFLQNLDIDNTFFKLAIGVLLIAAVLSRFLFVDEKPFHHDESIHAYFSALVASGKPYSYDAVYHGPFLYYFVGPFMYLTAITDLTARLPAALFGSVLVALPLMLRRQIGRTGVLVLMGILLISPTTLYYGRFLREDVFTSVWVYGSVFGLYLYHRTRKPIALFFGTVMLALHFCNKENSYLHALVWSLGLVVIQICTNIFKAPASPTAARIKSIRSKFPPIHETLIYCFCIFVAIFAVFYSSFGMHEVSGFDGMLDGLYRKSLGHWFNISNTRRIDGAFDYYLPMLANYEFFLIPFVGLAWFRVVSLANRVKDLDGNKSQYFVLRNYRHGFKTLLILCALLLLGTCFLPRIALVNDACSYAEICLPTDSPGAARIAANFATLLHISHTRHLLQILCYIVLGGAAFFGAIHLSRKADAFLWFWLVGALGIYSHVGEKVPWLTVYLVLPIALIAATEITRLFHGRIKTDLTDDAHGIFAPWSSRTQCVLKRVFFVWVILAVPFTVFKALRLSFPNAADPRETLVFTQTTTEARQIALRLQNAFNKNRADKLAINMSGNATWPYAWYLYNIPNRDFTEVMTPEKSEGFDAMFIDEDKLEDAKKKFPGFKIYSLSMRKWWVVGPDPTYRQLSQYFFTGQPYSRDHKTENLADTGESGTSILYLERANPKNEALKSLPPPDFLKRLN